MARKITIRTNILSNILFVVIVVAFSLVGLQYYFAKKMALEATEKTFRQLSSKVAIHLQGNDRLARETLHLMSVYPMIFRFPPMEKPETALRLMATPMRRNPNVYAVYSGYGNGDFFEVVNLQSSPSLRKYYKAPTEAGWMLVRIFGSPSGQVKRFDFYDAGFRRISGREEPTSFATTERPWYRQAPKNGKVFRGDPYLFFNLKKPGITYSLRLKESPAVLALDITLENLDALLRRLKFSPESEIAMFTHDGRLIADSQVRGDEDETALGRAIREGRTERIFFYKRNGKNRLAMLLPLSEERGKTTWLGFSVDEAAMMAPYLEGIYMELAAAMVLLLLMLPLVRMTTGRIVRPIHALMRENQLVKERRFEEVRRIDTDIIELDQLSRSLVEMAESIHAYQESQKRLLDSFIRLIADAIDAKSPYTGGHCKRVPLLAEMLLNEANASEEGEFADFRLEGKEALEEFERGAWLHDCGKITTPEYVVDKATKLETITNRIHEIRTRFEILWRDTEIEYYKGMLAGEDPEELSRRKIATHARLLEDFDFVARVNIGGEFMDEKLKERVRRIARRTWLRHFDDRLGLSEAELERLRDVPRSALPAEEPLLADRPEHRIPRTDFDRELYEKSGFTMEVPEWLYDRGEIYNLCIERGTLTPEERFKINEHVVMTIRMLERLPLPDNMKRIPEYAGTHHEHMDGTGYPRSLDAGELSVPSRIMAIADIFEALTAVDRPYKNDYGAKRPYRSGAFLPFCPHKSLSPLCGGSSAAGADRRSGGGENTRRSFRMSGKNGKTERCFHSII